MSRLDAAGERGVGTWAAAYGPRLRDAGQETGVAAVG
jgi:hypothetical protein